MALEYHTGFDLLPTGSVGNLLLQMGWNSASAGLTAYASPARTGTRALGLGNTQSLILTGLTAAPTRVLGFGLYLENLNGVQYGLGAVNDGVTPQISVGLDTTGHVEIRRGPGMPGGGGTLLATSVNALVGATWHFIELVVTVHASAGTVEVYVNGSKSGWIDLPGVNTQQTANAYSNAIMFAGAVFTSYIDDLYTLTTTGAAPTARLGDCKTVLKLAGTDVALGAGVYGDSTPSSGTDRGAMVDETPADDDTTYTSLTAAAQKDAYKTVALGQTGTILGATVRCRLRKSDAGDGAAQVGLRSATTDDFGGDVLPSDTSYQWFSRQYPTNPATGTAWTVATIDSAQILVKRTL